MNGSEQKKALEAIRMMLGARSNGGSAITADTVKAYLIAVSDYPLEAIEAACIAFIKSNVLHFDFDYFPPNAPRLAIEVAKWTEAQAGMARVLATRQRPALVSYPIGTLPPPPLEELGPTKLEIGGMVMDVSDWTLKEKTEAMATGKIPESRKVAGVPLKLKRF